MGPKPTCGDEREFVATGRREGADRMWRNLEEAIRDASTVRIREREKKLKAVFDENVRRQDRSIGKPHLLEAPRPEPWALDRGFNPYWVRKRADAIAHSMRARFESGTYAPRRPAGFFVPKADGGQRLVATFQIADEVISNRLLRSLSRKNLPRFSSRAYAYRADLTPHDAIAYARTELRRQHRVFVAEYDFTKFFDRVSHQYLLGLIDRLEIVISPTERRLVERFLESPNPYTSQAEKLQPTPPRTVGIPQGSSLSLFLANLAATELDQALERLGVGFVRYADDTLVWSEDYARICAAAEAIHHAADTIGSPINTEKSNGIRLLVGSEDHRVEMSSTTSVDYLGHTLTLGSTRMKEASVERIKRRLAVLIFSNLLREPLQGTQDPSRLTQTDRDYVRLIWQIRRYLYGPLSETEVRKFHQGSIPPMSFEGVMSFFPLVEDEEQLAELDAWLSAQIWLAMRKRRALLAASGLPTPAPHSIPRETLIGFTKPSSITGHPIDLRIPSFRRISKVIRQAVQTHGLAVVSGGGPLYLYEGAD